MSFLIGLIYGVCIMSVFSLIGIELLDRGKDYGELFCGPALWVVVICAEIYGCIINLHKLNERGLVWCPDEKIRWCKSKDIDALIETAQGYGFVPIKCRESEGWDVSLWHKNYPGNTRYTPQTIWKRYEQVDKAVVSKARKEYKEYLERHGDE